MRDFLQQPVVNGFVLHHRCEQTLLALTAVDEASILIGPEGGLSEMKSTKPTKQATVLYC
ncbi:Ribosomal RNA small subunit methyltransferase E (EC [uncultured Gammaproteobacteria bacterium]|nr:Ribosomal RNA small subunit methyltransferase E (EC [uncultured Gammaproteobacteria bacterium]